MPMSINQPKIIIVDDSQSARQTLAEIFHDYDATLFFAENGTQLLSLLKNETFDLFIIDVNMPDIDGITLTQKIREKPAYQNIPILISTALIQSDLIVEAFKAGANDYVQKPPNYFEIRARVTNLLDKCRAELRVQNLLGEVQVRNQRLTKRSKEIQTTIDALKAQLDLTKNKLNKQLISSSESSMKSSDLLVMNQHLSDQIKTLSGQNLELKIMLNEKSTH